MMSSIDTSTRSQRPGPTRVAVLATVGICVVLTGGLFVLARELGWTPGWLYLGLFAVHIVVNTVCLLLWNPGLIGRRAGLRAGTKAWDMVWLAAFSAIVFWTIAIAMRDLDTRGDELGLPGIMWLTGATIFVSGWMLFTWSMVANPFFEKTVRIQTDQGHRVVDKGPYAHIRHPG